MNVLIASPGNTRSLLLGAGGCDTEHLQGVLGSGPSFSAALPRQADS